MYLGVVVSKSPIIEKKTCAKNDTAYILLYIRKLYPTLSTIRTAIVDRYPINLILNKWINNILIISNQTNSIMAR